jgi:hypothetical protein
VVAAGSAPAEVAADLVAQARCLPLAAALGGRPLDRRVRTLLAVPRAPLSRPVAVGLGAALLGTALLASVRGRPASAADADLQGLVDAEVQQLVADWRPQAVSVAVVDVASQQVVAEGTHGPVAAWIPGSVAKPFVALAALRQGDPIAAPELAHLLEVSDNDGFVALAARVGPPTVAAEMQAHGLGASAELSPTDLALGQFPATTVELARAYAQLDYTPAGRDVVALLTRVVHGERGTGRQAAVPGLTLAGKTGTARMADGEVLASFVGLVPAESPRWAVAVQVAAPEGRGWGGKVAAPGFARLARQLP